MQQCSVCGRTTNPVKFTQQVILLVLEGDSNVCNTVSLVCNQYLSNPPDNFKYDIWHSIKYFLITYLRIQTSTVPILSSSVTTVTGHSAGTWSHYGLISHDVGACQLRVSVNILLAAPATSSHVIGVG